MCGIAAIIERDPTRLAPEGDLQAMVDALVHRGPDDEGRRHLPGAALGMRRLAIVDVATGQQPISNETGDVHIVANGEIYNFLELRQELEAKGHRFRTRSSDIESLLHAYEEWGEGFLTRARGMFAVVIWDARTKTLLAARDRAGEKPLYYTLTGRGPGHAPAGHRRRGDRTTTDRQRDGRRAHRRQRRDLQLPPAAS